MTSATNHSFIVHDVVHVAKHAALARRAVPLRILEYLTYLSCPLREVNLFALPSRVPRRAPGSARAEALDMYQHCQRGWQAD